MSDTPKFTDGWKTMIDGTREPITESEADAIWHAVENGRKRQASAYPTTYDALRAYIDADERMGDLGWRNSIFDLQEGEDVAIAERGSTGIFRGFWRNPYLTYHDCVAQMGKHFIKRTADLTQDERDRMEACEADHAEYMRHQTDLMAQLAEVLESQQ